MDWLNYIQLTYMKYVWFRIVFRMTKYKILEELNLNKLIPNNTLNIHQVPNIKIKNGII